MRDPDRLVRCAQGLRSENGENSEYDRALVELVQLVLGISTEEADYRVRQGTDA